MSTSSGAVHDFCDSAGISAARLVTNCDFHRGFSSQIFHVGTVVHAHVDKLVNHIALTGDSLSGFIRVLHFAVGIVSGGAGMQVFQLQNFEERLRQL